MGGNKVEQDRNFAAEAQPETHLAAVGGNREILAIFDAHVRGVGFLPHLLFPSERNQPEGGVLRGHSHRIAAREKPSDGVACDNDIAWLPVALLIPDA
jgi:hypothetical protein